MSCEKRRCTYYFECFLELEVLLSDELTEALKTDECGMTLIAVIYLRIESQFAESTDTADTEKM